MAGTDPSFDRQEVEEALRFAMRMGAPNQQVDKATFHFKAMRVYPEGTRLDQEGKPLNPAVRAEHVRPESLTLDEVAVEFDTATPQELPVGTRIPTRVTLTLLDGEREQIKARTITVDGYDEEFAHEVELAGDRYRIGYRKPTIALFDMDVHQYVAYAMEES